MKKIVILIVVTIFWIPFIAGAETIYKWRDKDGALRFSNDPPPEHVTDYKTMESATAYEPNTSQPDNQRRSSFDQMVKQASEASEASRKHRQEAAETRAAEQKRIAEEQEKARRQAERKRLEAEIENIKKRAVSKTFPNGMKQAQIDALVQKIKNLESQTEQGKNQ